LVLLGLWTRLAVLPLMVVMLVAAFIIHLPKGFGEMEFVLLYLLIYLLLFVTGSGKYSIDKWMENKMLSKKQ
jgi:putative oxidoreductase